MAIDNLNYYTSWLPAWQQTDKYSNLPWFLKSKNLDIFSSSKSVRGTAWSEREQKASWVVDITPDGRFELHENLRVWDTVRQMYITPSDSNVKYFNLKTIKKIAYASSWWSENPSPWTPLKLFVKYGADGNRATIVIITTTLVYVYHSKSFMPKSQIINCYNCTADDEWHIKVTPWKTSCYFDVCFDVPWWTLWNITLVKTSSDYGDVTLDYMRSYQWNLRYNPNTDAMELSTRSYREITTTPYSDNPAYFPEDPSTWVVESWDWRAGLDILDVPMCSKWTLGEDAYILRVRLNVTSTMEDESYDGEIYFESAYGGVNSYTVFLPKVWATLRNPKQFWEWYMINNSKSAWVWAFEPRYTDEIVTYDTTAWYDFLQESVAPRMVWEKFADIVVADQYIYKFSNVDDVWYITIYWIDDPAWDDAINSSYPWIKFIWAARLNNIIYIIAEDRWVPWLYWYNWQELVKIISWDVYNGTSMNYDVIDPKEQYRFRDITIRRDNILMSTSDEKLFMYGNTYWGKWASVIFQADRINGETITKVLPTTTALEITTSQNGTSYSRVFLDNMTSKKYLTDWEVVYPITVWNHILEKEESDLYASYMLPSKDCKLEFWGLGNQYHYWTFTSSDDPWSIDLDTTKRYRIGTITSQMAAWDYYLHYIERNGDQYTFKLVWDLPRQPSNTSYKPRNSVNWWQWWSIRDEDNRPIMNYSYYNHFRKIWEVTADGYTEDYVRFHNINNKLELPKTHSIQIMVKGKGTINYTPELFGLNLVANQRDRW